MTKNLRAGSEWFWLKEHIKAPAEYSCSSGRMFAGPKSRRQAAWSDHIRLSGCDTQGVRTSDRQTIE